MQISAFTTGIKIEIITYSGKWSPTGEHQDNTQVGSFSQEAVFLFQQKSLDMQINARVVRQGLAMQVLVFF